MRNTGAKGHPSGGLSRGSVVRRWSCVATLALNRHWHNGSCNRISRGPVPATVWTVYLNAINRREGAMLPTDTTVDPSLHTLSFGCPDNLPVECLSPRFDRWRHLSGEYKIKYARKGDRMASSLDSPKSGVYLYLPICSP